MKAIMLIVKPQECLNLLKGDLSVLVKNFKPACDLPKDVYVYCTNERALYDLRKERNCKSKFGLGDKDTYDVIWSSIPILNGKVTAKFTLNKIETIKLPYTKFGTHERVNGECERTLQTETLDEKELLKASCYSENEIYRYLNFKHSPDNVGYAWHVNKLKILNKPKEISEFVPYCKGGEKCFNCEYHFVDESIGCFDSCSKPLTNVPKTYCYIEI